MRNAALRFRDSMAQLYSPLLQVDAIFVRVF